MSGLSSFVSERHLRTDVRPDERSTEYQRTEARPMHPKSDPDAAASFKKTSATS